MTNRAVAALILSSAGSYERLMRVLGGLWFLLLALFVAQGVVQDGPWPARLSSLCLATFYLVAAFLIRTRSPPTAQAEGMMPRVAAFVGTYLPWTITFFGRTHQTAPSLASSALVLIGMVMMLVSVRHLGWSFSLVPQARRVVQSGPYRWVRHPLYLSEEIAIIGAALRYLTPVTVTIVVLHFAVQVCRILYEEDLLRRTCPEYASYASSRWRLIPYIW